MWRSVKSYLRHAVGVRPDEWYPMLAVYYLTYACDFRCPYCSDGAAQPYYRLKSRPLPADRVMKLLKIIRRHSDYLVITGGEPLKHPDFARVIDELPRLKYDGVVLTTNGLDVAPHLERLSRAVKYLVFSVDTLDAEKADACYGVGPGTFARIQENIEEAAGLPGRRYEIIISAVAKPDNLEDLFEVFDFAQERGYRFAVCPQLVGVNPHEDLWGNPRYRRLFDHMIAEKKRGGRINGSVLYLEHMRDLKKFDCRPSTMLAVAPTGEVFYPCLELGNLGESLLETPDLHAVRRSAIQRFGQEPSCDNRCHSACALGFSLVMDHPTSVLHEAYLMAKSAIRS